jgi:sporulation protein YlmC with PRC-barrel domain
MRTCVTLVRAGALVAGLLVLGPVQAPMSVDPPVTVPLLQTAASLDAAEHFLLPPSMLAIRALLKVPITTADGAQLGHLDDVLIDPKEGQITMAIVAAGGRFGLGGRFIALPWPMLRPAADGTALVIALGPALPRHLPPQEAPEDVPPR